MQKWAWLYQLAYDEVNCIAWTDSLSTKDHSDSLWNGTMDGDLAAKLLLVARKNGKISKSERKNIKFLRAICTLKFCEIILGPLPQIFWGKTVEIFFYLLNAFYAKNLWLNVIESFQTMLKWVCEIIKSNLLHSP